MYHIYAKRHIIVHFALGFSISKTRPFQVVHSIPNAHVLKPCNSLEVLEDVERVDELPKANAS
jgi:hypothetical protein